MNTHPANALFREIQKLPTRTFTVKRSAWNDPAIRRYHEMQAAKMGAVIVIDETPEPVKAETPPAVAQPRWTRRLSYDEQLALSSADFDDYFDWLMSYADHVCFIRERAQRGAQHQGECLPDNDPYNLSGPHHSSRAGE